MKLKTLKTYLLFLLGYLGAFMLVRLAFFLAFNSGGHSAGDIARAFLTGMRLDLSLSALFAGPLVFVAGAAGFWGPSERAIRPLAGTYLAALNLLWLLLCLAEFPFYHEYSCRLNHLFFEYFDKPKELFVTIAGIRFVLPLAAAFLAAAWFAAKGSWKLNRAIFARLHEEKAASRAISLLCVAALSVLFIRGGFQRRPLNWGAAFFSQDNFVNQTALNGIYNLYSDIQIFIEERRLELKPERYFASPQQALDAVRAVSHYETEAAPEPLLALPAGAKPNVVMIFMESFAAAYVGALGANPGMTPEFDRLAERGVLFTRFYGNATRTSRGLAAALNSYPPLAGVNMTKKIEAQQPVPNVAAYLAPLGYDTVFFYGGDRHFEDMSGFALNNGFASFRDFTDFPAPRHGNPIGVYDEELFENVDRELRAKKEPFFAAVMTLTNHGPFTVPDDFPPTPGLSREMRAFRYSDYALGKFLALARKSPYYKNTVFIIEADHASFVPGYGADRFHIPLLFFSPLLKKPARDARVASQLDLPMTVLRMCGAKTRNTDTPFWGLSLAERKNNGMAFVLDDPYFGVITAEGMYRESFQGQGFAYGPDGKAASAPFPAALVNYARGVKEGSSALFFQRKAADRSWKTARQ